MSELIKLIDKIFYLKYQDNWDDLLLRDRILELLSPKMEILDLGAGAGILEQMNFRGLVNQISGVDLDPRVQNNPYLDEGVVSDVAETPYQDNSFDLVFCDNVFEHLENPILVFKEVARILKPGGIFIFKTPNKFHYMPIIAKLTPHIFHQIFNKLRGRESIDTFPTRYRANSKRDIVNLTKVSGFEVIRIERIEGRPEYLRINVLIYLIQKELRVLP
jgi:SAM-dependent methyltransferase